MPHTTDTDTTTSLVRDTDAEALWFRDVLVLIRLSGEQTGGRFAVMEALAPQGSAAPRHTQPQDETFLMLEGEMDHYIDDATFHAGPGDTVYVPEDTIHAFRVTSDTARFISIDSPAGHERFFRLAGRPATERTLPRAPAPVDLNAFKAAAREAGFDIVGPPPPADA